MTKVSTRRRSGKKGKRGRDGKLRSSGRSVTREYTEALIVAGITALLIKTFVIQAFRIPSGSMEDTLLVGDFLLVNKFLYGASVPFTDTTLPAIRDPQSGDVIVFQYPEDPTKDYIKRCVAVAGETVEIRDKVVFVNGEIRPMPPEGKHISSGVYTRAQSPRDNWGPETVPPGHLFMMGDNRDNSTDSRFWGMLDTRLIRGQAFILYMSWEFQLGDPELTWTLDQPVGSAFSLLYIVAYDIVHAPWRVRWTRIGHLIE
ncbi:MAG: signal peptidase I [Candidatus Latescibacteria bacterium]|jgi:signal peptidase I|nr:signal peptidase I [Candidatus Latescibacterota bacterium]